MTEIFSNQTMQVILVAFAVVTTIQILVFACMMRVLGKAQKERSETHREIFGLVRKIEGYTAHRREQMLKHYDGVIEKLAHQIPTAIAAEAGTVIFETESKILQRLAEIEPNLKEDETARKRLDDLITNMENLEHTLITLTSDAVQKIMLDGRQTLIEAEHKLEKFNH
ncbi:MAG: hypothetical protein R3A13_11770 [Bdellovibrionota bacterium]